MSTHRAALWGTLISVVLVATSLVLPSLGSDGGSTDDLAPLSPSLAEVAVTAAGFLLVAVVVFVAIHLMTARRSDHG